MVLHLHVLLVLAPGHLLLVLPLFFLLQVVLERTYFVNELTLVALVRFHIRFDGDACFDDVLLEFDSIGLGVFVIGTRILHVLQVVVNDGALVIERSNGRL